MKKLFVFVLSLLLLSLALEISAGSARKMCMKKLNQVLMFICNDEVNNLDQHQYDTYKECCVKSCEMTTLAKLCKNQSQ
uniref:Putative 6.3 kDa secreted peptide n=1 Tax=Aedes aegypti TaxID=7159 RepID=Q1HRF5_AEDAE|nr:putative 6.3 kDa secreted peptide [Aedes aegypti]